MATVACKCGEKFHPSPEHFGKEVRCRRCGRMVKLNPDPDLEPPPSRKSSPFTQTFNDRHAPPPQAAYRPYSPPAPQPAPPPAEPEPALDPNAPRGLHPEIRRVLIYVCIAAAVLSVVLVMSSFRDSPPPAQAPMNMDAY